MLRKRKSWDNSLHILTHEDQIQKEISSVHQHTSDMTLHLPKTTDIQAFNMEKDSKHEHNMAKSGNYETTSEAVNLLSVIEDDDEPPSGVKWPLLKEHKKVILYQWTGLTKKPRFLKKVTKGSKEENNSFAAKVKKTEDPGPGVSHDKMSRLNHLMESFRHRSNKTTVNKDILCPVIGNGSDNMNGPNWAEEVSMRSYVMQKNLELVKQFNMADTRPLENETEYLHLLPKGEQHQAAQVQLEKSNHPISAEIAHLQLCQKKLLELEQSDLSNQLYLVNGEVDGMNADPQLEADCQNPSTHLTSGQESCTMQVIIPYSYDRGSSSAFLDTSNPDEGILKTESLDRKCCNTEPLIKEITEVKTRQDFLEKECLHLCSRYHTDSNTIMELLHEQHHRYSQLLVNMNDLQEQQNAEIIEMKEVIHFMEEMVAYQSYEQARDISDELALFQSRLSKIETQQKQLNSPAEVNSIQRFYSKVLNLLLSIVTNTSQVMYGKVIMNCLPVVMTFLLICLSAVSIHATALITPFYTITTLVFMVLSYGVLHNWSTASVSLQRSRAWVLTYVTHLFNRLINENDFMSAIVETWELFFGG